MSNRIVMIALLVSLSPSALASRATTSVLGTGDGGLGLITSGNGGLFYDDPYNVFYNPSYLANYKGWATVERSNSAAVGAQGGLIYNLGKITFGAYVNRIDSIKDISLSAGGVGAAAVYSSASLPSRPIELLFAADLGVKLGAGLTIASTLNPSYTNSYYGLNLGAQLSIVEPFLQMGFGRDTAVTYPGVGHLYFSGGTRVRIGEYTPYVLGRFGVNTVDGGANHNEVVVGGGFGRSSKMAEAIRLNWTSGVWFVTGTSGVTSLTFRRVYWPLEVSAEADVAVWLTLRAGLTYALVNRTSTSPSGGPDNALLSAADNTSGRLGASIHVSRMDFDWAIGSTAGAENLAGTTFDFANGFFTQASLSFRL